MALIGKITEWQRERGFGYLDHNGLRVFLHIREFKERHKLPEVGDEINFVMGTDRQGRPCAQQAVHVNDGGRLRLWHFGLLAVLLILPGVAVYRVSGRAGLNYAAGWMPLMSALAYVAYSLDKRRAREKGQREPETHLHAVELLGGWPGAFLAQRKLRHKSSKGPYQFWFVIIIGLYQLAALDALRGWPALHHVLTIWHRLN